MSERLDADFLHEPAARTLAGIFDDRARFVGGAVRDALLGRAVHDFDLATILTPEQTMATLEKAGLPVIPLGLAHGTVATLVGGVQVELTTLRRDTACDGRHAVVEYTTDWREDALRRDFTMNALLLGFDGTLYDFTDGVDDARAGKVRFIGEPRDRIAEDYLRVLRFFRFQAHYGREAPDAEALAACAEAASHLASLAAERVQQEWLKLLAAPKPAATIALMEKAGVVRATLVVAAHPALSALEAYAPEPLTFLALMAEDGAALAARLKLSSAQTATLAWRAAQKQQPAPDERALKHLIRTRGRGDARAVVQLHATLGNSRPEAQFALVEGWSAPEFPVKGADLLARGYTEGRALGEALKALEVQWEASDYTLDKAALLTRL